MRSGDTTSKHTHTQPPMAATLRGGAPVMRTRSAICCFRWSRTRSPGQNCSVQPFAGHCTTLSLRLRRHSLGARARAEKAVAGRARRAAAAKATAQRAHSQRRTHLQNVWPHCFSVRGDVHTQLHSSHPTSAIVSASIGGAGNEVSTAGGGGGGGGGAADDADADAAAGGAAMAGGSGGNGMAGPACAAEATTRGDGKPRAPATI